MDATNYAALPRLTISLQVGDTPDRWCSEYVGWLFPMFTADIGATSPGYSRYGTGTSVAVLPDTYDEWFAAVGYGKRRTSIRKAHKLGYTFAVIDRDGYLDDIHEINTSREERQGRPMPEAYRKKRVAYGPLPDQPCPRHRLNTYGVLLDDRLVAYCWVYQTGEQVLLSTLLGHGDHLHNGVMYLLIAGVLRDAIETAGARYAVYERHSSGTDGLRVFKEHLGFLPCMVTWRRGDERPPTPRERAAKVVTAWREQRARLGRVRRAAQRRLSSLRSPS